MTPSPKSLNHGATGFIRDVSIPIPIPRLCSSVLQPDQITKLRRVSQRVKSLDMLLAVCRVTNASVVTPTMSPHPTRPLPRTRTAIRPAPRLGVVANGLVSYYTYNTPSDIYVWHYPSGNGLGVYNYFTTGPVVPLISTLGIDNMVVFMEKTATSPTPGSAGSYVLDLTTKLYRTLHPKTDVLCSAGITLPDKAGRQLVAGGWSGDSTFGIRLYTPGGENDWEENGDEVRLAEGRWYPTSMIMANGSVRVVGGENGLNGAPTPSMEILPGGNGIRHMQWLKDTDPFK